MRKTNRTIWFNVTSSAAWKRPPVGIIRVEKVLLQELSLIYGDRIKQCRWVDGKFVEVRLERDDFMEAPVEGVSSQDKPRHYIYPILPRRQAVVAIVQGIFSIAPEFLRPALDWAFGLVRPPVMHSIDGLSRILNNWRNSVYRTFFRRNVVHLDRGRGVSVGNIFSPGDVLLSFGLDWNYSYYKEIYFLKKNFKVKILTCCYDLIPVLYPQYCVGDVSQLFASYFLDLADGSDMVLCISKQSEMDFRRLIGESGGNEVKTRVFELGDSVPVSHGELISDEVSKICGQRFILFVSTIERRKNHEVLYRAYHLIAAQGRIDAVPYLVFVGMEGWGVGDIMQDIATDPLVDGKIIRLSHVNDSELNALYLASEFCLYPSLYEGWGLPVGEALALGKVVIASNRGSIPEVGGDLVRYADPWNPSDWADEIYRMSTDKIWRAEWESLVRTRYKTRSWRDAANNVADAIEAI